MARIASFEEDSGLALTLANIFRYYHLDPRSLYKFASFSRLSVRAGVRDEFTEPLEEVLTKAMAKFAVVDSRRWIQFILKLLENVTTLQFEQFSGLERRMFRMFYMTVWSKAFDEESREALAEKLTALAESPAMVRELQELLRYRYDQIDFIDEPVDLGFDCPLDLHCSYSRDQILAAMDFLKPATVREGVKWLSEQKLDVFFVTLNKSDKDYSPTTMYNDYSINETLFHWQSQSTTGEQSATGQRYIYHRKRGSRILLFVREFKSDRISNTAAAYTYLGTANYVKHEGSKPMNITWRLDAPIPAKYLRKTNKLVVG